MSIDERLREGLPPALDDVRPDVDAALAGLLDRAERRSLTRRAAYAVALVAAGLVAAVAVGLNDPETRSVDPAAPGDQVQVLDSERGSADEPAPLEPGRYAIPFVGAPEDALWGELDVPPGWSHDRLLLATGPDLDPHLRRIELLAVDRVADDPCVGDLAPVEATVADIVGALVAQRYVHPSTPAPASVGGYDGQVVSFHVPADLDVSRCQDGTALRPLGLGVGHTSVYPGWDYRLWVLDVNGDPRVVLAAHGPRTTSSELAELTAMVNGLTFVAPR